MNPPPTNPKVHLAKAMGAVIFSIVTGTALGIANTWSFELVGVEFIIGGILGAIVGFAISPLVVVATCRRSMDDVLPIIFVPSLFVAIVSSNIAFPFLGAGCTILTYIVCCALCIARIAVDPIDPDMSESERRTRDLSAIERQARNPHPTIRFGAVRAAGRLHTNEAASLITAFLHDDNWCIRIEAILAIERNFGSRLLSALHDRLPIESNELVTRRLTAAIHALSES